MGTISQERHLSKRSSATPITDNTRYRSSVTLENSMEDRVVPPKATGQPRETNWLPIKQGKTSWRDEA
ncbi:hypothetical protein M404DRAFT_991936 [Pisolithus tinctorius Marx 270]|uniref:Uncharacterized protein n=1 Tax=Pisolithus tinctorius Marx 270 TaxID=870435 RepID=A0A0C3K1C1_PISTI|nr:hypothetical protein M404DRAFT_991936 [Pisolithus tinctorius Marx 270]